INSAALGKIYLAWLDPDPQDLSDGTGDNATIGNSDDRWVNAINGNFVTGAATLADLNHFANVQDSWQHFASTHGINNGTIGNFVGAFGGDTTDWSDDEGVLHGGRVWAVVDHASDFAV